MKTTTQQNPKIGNDYHVLPPSSQGAKSASDLDIRNTSEIPCHVEVKIPSRLRGVYGLKKKDDGLPFEQDGSARINMVLGPLAISHLSVRQICSRYHVLYGRYSTEACTPPDVLRRDTTWFWLQS